MGGVYKLYQFRSYYDVGLLINTGDMFYTYYSIAIINSFICFKKSKSTHPRYY